MVDSATDYGGTHDRPQSGASCFNRLFFVDSFHIGELVPSPNQHTASSIEEEALFGERIVPVMKQAALGVLAAQASRKVGISEQNFYLGLSRSNNHFFQVHASGVSVRKQNMNMSNFTELTTPFKSLTEGINRWEHQVA